MSRIKDLTGMKFGKLSVLEFAGKTPQKNAIWLCECECGKKIIVKSPLLTGGGTKSCGCFTRQFISESRIAPLNEIVEEGNIAKIVIKKKDGTILHAIIDKDDLPRIIELGCRWHAKIDKKNNCHYVRANSKDDGSLSLHRFITNCPEGLVVDHINHNGLDNRKRNLKIVTVSENKQNLLGAQKNSSTGIRGVSWHKATQTWRARIKLNNKLIELGRFEDLHEAERVVKRAREKHFTNLNPLFK